MFRRNYAAKLAVSLADLVEALTAGWEIDLPIHRKQLPDRPDGAWYCDLVLWRDGQVRLLTLAEDAALRAFLVEHNLTVDG